MSDRSFFNGSSMSVLLKGEVGIVSSGATFCPVSLLHGQSCFA